VFVYTHNTAGRKKLQPAGGPAAGSLYGTLAG